MSIVDYLLDGLEAELVLERELGLRSLECDRKLLGAVDAPVAIARPESPPSVSPAKPVSPAPSPVPLRSPVRPSVLSAPVSSQSPSPSSRAQVFDFVFLHDRPLSPEGIEMMSKIITALGKTADTAPIVIAPPLPKAKFYVVLGGLAMYKFFPGMKGEPGQWYTSESGEEVLITYSPTYILRFKEVTEALMKIKKDMWRSLKAMLKKL